MYIEPIKRQIAMVKLLHLFFIILTFTFISAKEVDSLLNLYNQTTEHNKQIEILIELSEVTLQDSFALAYQFGSEAINLLAKQKNSNLEGESFYNMAMVFAHVENFDSAVYYLKLSKKYFTKNNNKNSLLRATLKLGNCYSGLNNKIKPIEYYKQALALAEEAENTDTILLIYNELVGIYHIQSEYKKAIEVIEKRLIINLELKDSAAIANSYNGISDNKRKLGYYTVAIEYNQKAMDIFIEIQDTMGIANSYLSLGAIYYYNDDYPKAIKYFIKASEIFEIKGKIRSVAGIYNNIGSVYIETKNFNKALLFYIKALNIYEDIDFLYAEAIVTGNIGLAYEGFGNYSKAMHYFKKSLEYQKQVGNKEGVTHAISNIAGLYLTKNRLADAKIAYKKALDLAIKGNFIHEQLSIYEKMIEVEERLGNFKKTIEVMRKHQTIKDSLLTQDSREQLNELQAKLELHENKAEIDLLSKKNEIQKAKVDKQRLIIAGIVIISILFLILIIIILYALVFSRKTKSLLENQNKEIVKNRNEIAQKNKDFTDSITYAGKTQKAMLNPIENLKNGFKDFFIVTKPHSIVSGDFYWFKQIDKKIYIALADCMGHGVPGAFMSILGITFLNEIVDKNPKLSANKILDELRDKIKVSLHQKNYSGNVDGLDISFCIFNKNKTNLEFAGAYNPLYIVRQNKIIELKADKMTVSISRNEKPFSLQNIEIQKGDRFYLSTDGFYDQFGGTDNTKISRKIFKTLLIQYQLKPLKEQATAFESFFVDWKAQTDQTDDMSIIGFEL